MRPTTVASAGAVALAAHAAHNARMLRVPPPAAPVHERVSVLLPLRNEANRVAPCLSALLTAAQLPALEILILDDGSTDGTSDVVRHVAGGDPRVQLLPGRPLPLGWLGKPHACAQLAEAASGTALVFLDADVVLAPDGLARTVGLLRGAGLDLVSPYPRQVASSAAERLIQPLLQWSWLTFLPLRLAECSPRSSLAAANGQLLCVDAAAYRRAGGHGAIRDAVLDDVALLRAVKRAGGCGTVADGTEIATTRMYDNCAQLREGYAKSLWAAGGGTIAASAGQLALLGALYLMPPLAALRSGRRTVGLLGYAGGVAGRVIAAHRTGGQAWPDALAHPLSVSALAALTALSWVGRRRGNLRWKDRPV